MLKSKNYAKETEGSSLERLREELPEVKFTVEKTKKAKHIFSHVEWHMEGLWIEVQKTEDNRSVLPGEAQKHLAEAVRLLCQRTEAEEQSAMEVGIKDEKKMHKEQRIGDWVFVTPQEMQEKYPIPSAFESCL